MKGIEGAGKGKHLGKSLDAPEVQAAAMLAAFKNAHRQDREEESALALLYIGTYDAPHFHGDFLR